MTVGTGDDLRSRLAGSPLCESGREPPQLVSRGAEPAERLKPIVAGRAGKQEPELPAADPGKQVDDPDVRSPTCPR